MRKSKESIRINVQLIKTQNGEQIWGKQFDSQLEALFSLEDQVTRSIVAIIKGKIDLTDQKTASRKPAKDMQSYDLLMRGRFHFSRFTPEDSRLGIELLKECLDRDPNNATAHNVLYTGYITDWLAGWSYPRSETIENAGVHATRAIKLNPDNSNIQASYSEYLTFIHDFEQAEAYSDRAIALNPNDTETLATVGSVHACLGNIEKALELADTCRQLDTFHPWVDLLSGITYYRAKRYEDALNSLKAMPSPSDEVNGWIAACYQRLGEHELAKKYLKLFLEIAKSNMAKIPETLGEWKEILQSTACFRYEEGIDYPFDALCEAGLADLIEPPVKKQTSVEMHNIAVLPFDNLSGDPEQEYFSDGITESIILNLSLFPGLNVKSRNSSFAFKQQIKSLGEISKKLNVDYVVEGSIRKSDDRIRITVQLVEAQSGNQIWGKRYECDLSNLFGLEEELSRTIAATVTGQIESDLQRISIAKDAAHQESYDLLLSGAYYTYKFTREDTIIAVDYLNQCLQQDSECVRAHTLLYMCHSMNSLERWVEDGDCALKTAGEHAHKALSLSPETAFVLTACAEYAIFCRDYEAADRHCNKALEINPNDPDALATKAFNEVMLGNFETGLRLAETCYQLDPYHPWCDWILADAQFSYGRYEDVLNTIENSKSMPGFNRIYVTAAYVKLGKPDLAAQALQVYLQAARDEMLTVPTSVEEWLQHSWRNTPFKDTSINQGLIDCLVQAGLCDELTEQNDGTPSIAVLPFENMSGDPEQEFFSDGITTDVISILSRFPRIRAVARHSTMQYRDQKTSIADIAKQQNVRYILEGSVRKSGDRIRVSADLIDANNEESCWSERYDRELDDIFVVQDDITKNIAAAMKVHFEDGDRTLQRASGTRDIKAWELVLNASDLQDSYIHQNILESRIMINAALEIDPGYCFAWVSLGWSYWQEAYTGWCESFKDSILQSEKAVDKALELVPESGDAWILKGNILLINNQAEAGLEACKKAVELEPGNAEIQMLMAYAHCHIDKFELASEYYRTAMKLCPVCPSWYFLVGGEIEQHIGSQENAIKLIRQAIEVEPDSPLARFYLINVLLEQGDEAEARQLAEEIRVLDKSINGKGMVRMHSQNPARREGFQINLVKTGFEA